MTQLATNRFLSAEFGRNIWVVTSEVGTPVKAMLDPGFWAHVSVQMAPRDRIEVTCEDNSFFAELLVVDAGKLFAKVAVIREVKLTNDEKSDLVDHVVSWGGNNHKWRVIRKGDRALIKGSFELKQDAELWALSHEKTLAESTKAA